MNKPEDGLKRYNLVLPEEMFNEVRKVADEQQTSMVEVIRKFIKLGLMVSEMQESPEMTVFIKRGGGEEQQIIFI
ncbi:MAG: hypothetical protein JW953_12200 [Anaerolineae bacterium]|nr:hypothetical protein [Anaerolineae bacterium]